NGNGRGIKRNETEHRQQNKKLIDGRMLEKMAKVPTVQTNKHAAMTFVTKENSLVHQFMQRTHARLLLLTELGIRMNVKGDPEKQAFARSQLQQRSRAPEAFFDYNCKLLDGMRIQRDWSKQQAEFRAHPDQRSVIIHIGPLSKQT